MIIQKEIEKIIKMEKKLQVKLQEEIDKLEISNSVANPSSLATGGGTALPSAPTQYFKVHYNGADRYIPYYT